MKYGEREGNAIYEAACNASDREELMLESWAKLLKERFMRAATGKEVHEMPVSGCVGGVAWIDWTELLGEYCETSTDNDEPHAIAGLVAAGLFPEAQLRSLAMLKRCADWYAESYADATVSAYAEELRNEAEEF